MHRGFTARPWLWLAALVAGCAVSAETVRPDEVIDRASAYVYGRFVIKAAPSGRGEAGRGNRQTVGLVMGCDDGRSYPILFFADDEVRAIKIQPARCALQELQYVATGGTIIRRRVPPPGWVHLDYFAPGHGYYLGDFFAVASHEVEHGLTVTKYSSTWDLDPVDDRFAPSTAELRRRFVGLTTLPLHDQRLAPRRPPPKQGLAGRDEPLMTPERIARIAGLVKESYTSPAACMMACPSGDCLPYRGPDGPAMTCIVHCRTSRDCRPGMACNCPQHRGPDCQVIAEAPGDPMEGICLPAGPPTTPI